MFINELVLLEVMSEQLQKQKDLFAPHLEMCEHLEVKVYTHY